MKKIIILLIFIPVFSFSMSCSIPYAFLSNAPCEIKLHILESLIKSVIENNSIFEPFNNVEKTINTIILINKEFYNLKPDLSNFARKYVKEYFACEVYNLPQEQKNAQLESIFAMSQKYDGANTKNAIRIAKLIIAGANPNLRLCLKDGDGVYLSPLSFIARTSNYKEIFNLLIQNGADIHAKDAHGNNILMLAVLSNCKKIIKLLLKCKDIDVNAKNINGNTALMLSTQWSKLKTVKLLLKHNSININAINNHGNNAIMQAQTRVDVIRLLLRYSGININIKNNIDYTILMYAVIIGNYNLVKMLLKYKNIDINLKNLEDKTAKDVALDMGYADIAQLIDKKNSKNYYDNNLCMLI